MVTFVRSVVAAAPYARIAYLAFEVCFHNVVYIATTSSYYVYVAAAEFVFGSFAHAGLARRSRHSSYTFLRGRLGGRPVAGNVINNGVSIE